MLCRYVDIKLFIRLLLVQYYEFIWPCPYVYLLTSPSPSYRPKSGFCIMNLRLSTCVRTCFYIIYGATIIHSPLNIIFPSLSCRGMCEDAPQIGLRTYYTISIHTSVLCDVCGTVLSHCCSLLILLPHVKLSDWAGGRSSSDNIYYRCIRIVPYTIFGQ